MISGGEYNDFHGATQKYVDERLPHTALAIAEYAVFGRYCAPTTNSDTSAKSNPVSRLLRFCAADGDCAIVSIDLRTNGIHFVASRDPLSNSYPSSEFLGKLWIEFGTDRSAARHYADGLRRVGVDVHWDEGKETAVQYRLRCDSLSSSCSVESHPKLIGRQ